MYIILYTRELKNRKLFILYYLNKYEQKYQLYDIE